MLRNRIPDDVAKWADVLSGVNLRDSLEDLKAGSAELMQNCYYDGGLRKRFGSTILTTTTLGAFRGRGGHRVYPQTASKFRLIAWHTNLAVVSDTGLVTTVTNSLTSDQDVHFETWSITDRTYVSNKSNVLCQISPTQTFSSVTGVNIPASPTMTVAFLDRLFAIQGDAVYSTNPRVDSVWSPNTSTWATYRPVGGNGVPTAIHRHSMTGQQGDPKAQLLIFQSGSITSLTGLDFGSDVTLSTPPTTWDANLLLLSSNIGTSSPYSIVTVPGLGTFWFTQDLNVAYLSFNQNTPQYVADMLFSNRSTIPGVNNIVLAQIGQVRMVYHDRKLKLFLPVPIQDAEFEIVQYWLDIRLIQEGLGKSALPAEMPSWSGPHRGQSVSALWIESQAGDRDAFYALEGGSTHGLFVYTMNDTTTFKDAVALTTTDVASQYRTFYHDMGMPTYQKWIPEVRIDFGGAGEHALVTLVDLHGTHVGPFALLKNDGSAFSSSYYGTGLSYGAGTSYNGFTSAQFIGHVTVESQGASSMLGDAIQVQVTHSAGKFVINNVIPQAQIRRTQQVD